jgi:drug/metabolite transporter (DMT)-like permease
VTSASTEPSASAGLDVRALVVLTAGVCTLAFTPILVRLSGVDPAAAGFWRLLFALPFLALPLIIGGGAGAASALRRPSRVMIAAAVFFALDLFCWHLGVKLTSVANSTTLANMAQVFVVIGAWFLFKETPRKLFLAGLALALGGVWAMAAAKGGGGHGAHPILGDLASLAAAVWYAAYILIVHKVRATLGPLRIMIWTSLIGAPLLLAGAMGLHEKIVPTSTAGWLACLGLGLVHAISQGAIAWALGRVPAATASVVILLQPVCAALLGWLILAEALVPMQAMGGLAALAGVGLAQVAASRKTAAESGSPITL